MPLLRVGTEVRLKSQPASKRTARITERLYTVPGGYRLDQPLGGATCWNAAELERVKPAPSTLKSPKQDTPSQ